MATTQAEVWDWIRDLTQFMNSEPPLSLMHCLEAAAQQQTNSAFRDILAGSAMSLPVASRYPLPWRFMKMFSIRTFSPWFVTENCMGS